MPFYGVRWFQPGDPMDVAREEFALMQKVIAEPGGRIIVGTDTPIPIGADVLRVEAGTVTCQRRATREEFVMHGGGNTQLTSARLPFYYEFTLGPSKL